MPTVAPDLRTDFDVHEEIPLADGCTLACPVYDSAGDIQEASGGTFELLGPGGNVLITGSIAGSATNTATYELTSAALASAGVSYGYRYRVRWELTIGSDTVVGVNMAGVVRDVVMLNVNDQDLLDLHGELLVLIQGTGKTDLSSWTIKAHQKAVRWMARQANRAGSILDRTDIKELVTAWALELLFKDLATGRQESHYSELGRDYHTARKDLQKTIQFDYDADQDGAVDDERRSGTSAVFFSSHGLHPDAHPGRYR